MKNLLEYINEGLFKKRITAQEFAKLMNGTWFKKIISLVPEMPDDNSRTWILYIRKFERGEYAYDKNGDPAFEEGPHFLSFPDPKDKNREYFSSETMKKIYSKVCSEVKQYNINTKTKYTVPKIRL